MSWAINALSDVENFFNPFSTQYLTEAQKAGATTPTKSTPTKTVSKKQVVAQAVQDTSGKFIPTEGWYVAGACIFGVATANTRFGPISFGILTIALIFQLSLLLQGK